MDNVDATASSNSWIIWLVVALVIIFTVGLIFLYRKNRKRKLLKNIQLSRRNRYMVHSTSKSKLKSKTNSMQSRFHTSFKLSKNTNDNNSGHIIKHKMFSCNNLPLNKIIKEIQNDDILNDTTKIKISKKNDIGDSILTKNIGLSCFNKDIILKLKDNFIDHCQNKNNKKSEENEIKSEIEKSHTPLTKHLNMQDQNNFVDRLRMKNALHNNSEIEIEI